MKKLSQVIVLTGALALLPFTRTLAEEPASSAPPPTEQAAVPQPEAQVEVTGTDVQAQTQTPAEGSKRTSRRAAIRAKIGTADNAHVSIWADTHIPADQTVQAAVTILGSTVVDGNVSDAVVSVLGSSTVNGKVGDAVVSILGSTTVNDDVGNSAVAVGGNVYVNGEVRDVVAVLGGVELGPKARVSGEVVSIGGPIKRDPAAVGGRQSSQIRIFNKMPDFSGLHAWVSKALGWGRPLAIGPGLGWAWIVAFVYLGLYVLIAAGFKQQVTRCAETLEQRPGGTILATIVAFILTPLISLLLSVTVIGPFIIPIVVFIATRFGKAGLLVWLGRRFKINNPPMAALLGGVILLLIYLIPFVGLVMWYLTSHLAFGLVVYTIILGARKRREERAAKAKAIMEEKRAAAAAAAAVAAQTQVTVAPDGTVIVPVEVIPTIPGAPVTPDIAVAGASLPRAGFWIRVGAALIDFVLVALVLKVLHLSFMLMPAFAAYNCVLWALKGTTIGGIVCGLRLVRLDDRPVDWGTAIVRTLMAFLSFAVAGLGFIWVAFDDESQSWHDKVAGTTIVHAPKGISLI